ncbi:MAG: SusC/RagA family TonB-linked outer membrane protein, partial [bacterium]
VKTTIDLTIRGGMITTPRFIPQLNDQQFKNLANEILFTSPLLEEEFMDSYPGLYLREGDRDYFPYQHNVNWQDKVFSNTSFTDYHLQVKGGDEIARYGLSVGYSNHGGVVKSSNFSRYNIRLVSRLNVYSWLRMYISASLSNTNSSLISSAYNENTSLIAASLAKSPFLNPYRYDDEGNRLNLLADVDEFGVSNPLAIINNLKAKSVTNRIISSFRFEADISNYMKGNILVGFNNNNMDEELYLPNKGMNFYYDGLAHNVSKGLNNKLFSIYSNNYINYDRRFSNILDIDATAGLHINTNRFEGDYAIAKNLPENDQFNDLQSGSSFLREVGGSNENWNWTSLYANMNLKFKDKYLLSTSASFENSTRNGLLSDELIYLRDVPFDLFYGIGLGWRLSGEGLLNSIYWLDNLTLKASYGKTGNDDIGSVNALHYYRQTKYRETAALVTGTMPNETLKHEEIEQINLGYDLSVFGDRFRLSMNYFMNEAKDLLLYEPLVSYMGYENRPVNKGSVKNFGIETSFTGRLINSANFKWDLNLNFTSLSNEVQDVSNGRHISVTATEAQGNTGFNSSINFYGYDFLGVYSTSSDAQEANLRNSRGVFYGAGDAIYRDISGPNDSPDGIIDDHDITMIGSALPDYFGGIINRLSYKQWTFSFFWYLVYGNELYNYVRHQNENMVDLDNQSSSVLNRWHSEGDVTDIPRALWNDPIGNSALSSRWIEDGSYLRLKNVTLSYKLRSGFLVFREAEFYLSANNVFTLSNYLGYDPEFSHSFNQGEMGIDYGMTPQVKQFLVGIKIGF